MKNGGIKKLDYHLEYKFDIKISYNMVMDFNYIWSKLDNYPGYFFPLEAESLFNALMTLPENSLAVELGSLYGRSSLIFGEVSQSNNFNVICVDNFCGESDSRNYFFNNILAKYPRVKLIEKTTDDAVYDFTANSIDLLFIDANHQDEGIYNDCKNYLPKVKNGGIVAFHDYNNDSFPSVKKWVDELTKGWEIIADNRDSIVIKRKPL